MQIEEFNLADRRTVASILRPCLDVDRWIDEVIESRPYADLDALEARALGAAAPLTEEEVAAALAHHPRIGERLPGGGAEARLSRSEQQGIGGVDDAVQEELLRGNREYEQKFGRVFLIRAAGRSAQEILRALGDRLANPPERENPIVEQQLREIAALRLKGTLTAMTISQITTHVLDTTRGMPAAGVGVALDALVEGNWRSLGEGHTDADGRAKTLGPESVPNGVYRLRYDTARHFADQNTATFFPEVAITFEVAEEGKHYHVPLLLSPFAYSTYRGS